MNQNQNITERNEVAGQNQNTEGQQNTTSKGTETEPFTIKQAAAQLGIPASTIRYYCGLGLIPHIKRTRTGYRLLNSCQLDQLCFIAHLSRCGFSTKELKRYATLAKQGNITIPERKALLATKKQQLWHQVRDLQNEIDFIERQEDYLG